jgi:signal peptidase I
MKNLHIKKFVYAAIFTMIIGISVLVSAITFGLTGKYNLYAVQSSSMEPAIGKGSIVLVNKIDEYPINSVVSYISTDHDNLVITHRIVAVEHLENGIAYQTRGDSNDKKDPGKITSGDIVGKVILDIPFLGFITNFARTQVGLILLIVIPSTIIIYNELLKIKRELKRTRINRKSIFQSIDYKKLVPLIITLQLMRLPNTNTLVRDMKTSRINSFKSSNLIIAQESLSFYFNDEKNEVGFVLDNISQYDQIKYRIEYERDGGLKEVVPGTIDNSTGANEIIREGITLGTCSTGGTCVYHQVESDINLTVELFDNTVLVKTVQQSLSF